MIDVVHQLTQIVGIIKSEAVLLEELPTSVQKRVANLTATGLRLESILKQVRETSVVMAEMKRVIEHMEGQFGEGTVGDDARAVLLRPEVAVETGRWANRWYADLAVGSANRARDVALAQLDEVRAILEPVRREGESPAATVARLVRERERTGVEGPFVVASQAGTPCRYLAFDPVNPAAYCATWVDDPRHATLFNTKAEAEGCNRPTDSVVVTLGEAEEGEAKRCR